MRPKRSSEHGGSLDSLLDTMTNVVGILIIVLVITQIKMADAVRRVQSNLPEVSAEQLAQLQKEFEALQLIDPDIEKERADLEKRLREAEATAETARKRIPEIRKELERLARERELAKQADVLNKQLTDLEKQKEDREKKMLALREEMKQLMIQLKKTPKKKTKEGQARVVRLPDPKTAPEGAQPRYFICRFGRLYYVDELALREALEKALLRGRSNLEYKNPKTRRPVDKNVIYYDWEKVRTYFDRFTVGTREFRFIPQISGDKFNRNMHYTLMPSPFAGETANRIAGPVSQYRNLLHRKLSKENIYLLFQVYPDSFEVYLKAREVLEEYNKPGGWVVKADKSKWFWSPHKLYRKETHGKTRPPPANPPPARKPQLLID